jgi:hypothetical protein
MPEAQLSLIHENSRVLLGFSQHEIEMLLFYHNRHITRIYITASHIPIFNRFINVHQNIVNIPICCTQLSRREYARLFMKNYCVLTFRILFLSEFLEVMWSCRCNFSLRANCSTEDLSIIPVAVAPQRIPVRMPV